MPLLSELTEYKRKIANLIVNDLECVKLLTGEAEPTIPAASLINKNIFLYDYVDETVKDVRSFVCIEVDEGDYLTPAARRYDLHIYVVVHRNMMNFVDSEGKGQVRRDAIAARIDTLLNGRTDLGFGKVKAAYGSRVIFSYDYRAKDMHYILDGWNLSGEALDRR